MHAVRPEAALCKLISAREVCTCEQRGLYYNVICRNKKRRFSKFESKGCDLLVAIIREYAELKISFSHAINPSRKRTRVNIAKSASYESRGESFTVGKRRYRSINQRYLGRKDEKVSKRPTKFLLEVLFTDGNLVQREDCPARYESIYCTYLSLQSFHFGFNDEHGLMMGRYTCLIGRIS